MNERAFVAGASGYVGQQVVRALRARHIETVAHVRPDSSSLERFRTEFASVGATLDATPWDEDAMTATLARIKPTLLFALLGTTRARAKNARAAGRDASRESYEAVDYGLSKLLLNACKRAGIAPRFIYLSSVGVNDSSTNPYLEVRARFERELKGSSLPYVIAQPSLITGPDREETRVLERVSAAVVDSILSTAGLFGAKSLRDRYSSIDAATLAQALVRLSLDESATNTTVRSDLLRR